MFTGIDSIKEWFKGSEEQYAIIGGTACDILMTEEGLDFRATKDIDLVLIIAPQGVYADIQEFVQCMKNENVDIKQLGLVGRTKEKILEELKAMYETL